MRVEIKHYFHQGNGIQLDPSVDKGNPLRRFKESFQEKNNNGGDFRGSGTVRVGESSF